LVLRKGSTSPVNARNHPNVLSDIYGNTSMFTHAKDQGGALPNRKGNVPALVLGYKRTKGVDV